MPVSRNRAVIREGLRHGDLKDMVLPLISVDEYESKITPEAVVIGFYVKDGNAANDLNRFVQKSPAPLLDTDVSPAPDQHGYFLVFVEILPDGKAGEHIKNLLGEIGALVDVSSWNMRVRHLKKLVDFSPRNFSASIIRARRKVVSEAIRRTLTASDLTTLQTDGYNLRFGSAGREYTARLLAVGSTSRIQVRAADLYPDVSLTGASLACRMANMLGEGWSCDPYAGGKMLLSNSANALLIDLG